MKNIDNNINRDKQTFNNHRNLDLFNILYIKNIKKIKKKMN